MKKLFSTISLALMSSLVLAVPAKRGIWKTVKLTDGSEVKVELRGDEFCSFWQAADGRTFVKDATSGIFKQAELSSLIEASAPMRKAAQERRMARLARVKPADNASGMKKGAIGGEHNPYLGTKKGLVILVDFSDTKFKEENTLDLYKRITNEENFSLPEIGFVGSVKDYFKAQSFGQFELELDVVGPVTMPNSYKFYGKPTSSSNDNYTNICNMVRTACRGVDDQVNFADYDWDGDGEVDQVFILYAGHGEATYDDDDCIWPHESELNFSITLDDTKIRTYGCTCELSEGESIDGIGAFCHEFSHCLGLADTYDTNYLGSAGPGSYDLMCKGCYNGNTFVPCGYTSFERIYAGWITPKELTDDQSISGMKPLSQNGDVYIYYNDNKTSEYYLLENRKKEGWDAEIPSEGLLVLHVDFDKSIWSNNSVNTNGKEHCTILRADNSTNNEARDLFPYNKNDRLTNASSPACKLNNRNIDGSYMMNKSLLNITKDEEGNISFDFENNNFPEKLDYVLPDTYVFYESFDNCKGKGGNDNLFNGTTVGKTTLSADNEGWSGTNARGANGCAMFGTSSSAGVATTPVLELNGNYLLKFKAAPYIGDGNEITVSFTNGEGEIETSKFTMREGVWQAFSTNITVNGNVQITFTPSKRFFLDKVCVTTEGATGISDILMDEEWNTNGRIYSIDGRYVGTDFNSLNKGIYIVNGKKIVK